MASNDFWSPKEDDLLMKWADTLPCFIIKNKLNYWHELNKTKTTRSLESVRWRMDKLGLSLKPSLDNMSGSEWARQLGVVRATITLWIKRNGLRCLKSHSGRLIISLQDMTNFAKKRPDLFANLKPEILEYFEIKKG